MHYLKAAHRNDFQEEHAMLSKTKNFIFRLQALESRLDKIKIDQIENSTSGAKEVIKMVKEYIAKMLGEKLSYSFSKTHWPHLKKKIVNSTETSEKKEIITNEIHYLKNYITAQGGTHWGETNHTDILYIYWYSRDELKTIEKIDSCLIFLDKEIKRLEKQDSKYAKKTKLFSSNKVYYVNA